MVKLAVTSLMNAMQAMANDEYTHYISAIGPEDACYNKGPNHLRLTFHDIETEEDNFISPNRDHVDRILKFSEQLGDDSSLLIHCMAGISRSTAIAIGIACQHGMTPKESLNHVRSIREPNLKKGYMVLPNRLIIQLMDDALSLNGELVREIDTYYSGLPLIGVTTLPNRGGWHSTT